MSKSMQKSMIQIALIGADVLTLALSHDGWAEFFGIVFVLTML